MNVESKKEPEKNNSSYKERFQFVLSVNDNIICQRYFRVNGLNTDSIDSVELKRALDECVQMIKNDLSSKSRIYLWHTSNLPLKLTGFADSSETVYMDMPNDNKEKYNDAERLKPYEVTFKFSFLIDEKPKYEYIWDGGDYPKYVRNSVDLSNSDQLYKGKDPLQLYFSAAIVRYMTIGKQDLNYAIINKIVNVMSSHNFTTEYHKSDSYGRFNIPFNRRNKKYYSGWLNATRQKTNDYFYKMYPSDKQLDYINKYL